MPVDTSSYRTVIPSGWADSFNSGMDRGMKMREMAEQKQKQQQMNDIFKRNMIQKPDGTTDFKRGQLMKELAGLDAGSAMKFQDWTRTKDMEDRKNKLAEAQFKANQLGQVLYAVDDPQSFNYAKQMLSSEGYDIRPLGDTYDPKKIEMLRSRALSVKDRLDLENKKLEYGMKAQEAGLKNRKHGLDIARFNLQLDELRRNQTKGNPTFGKKVQTNSADTYSKLQASVPEVNKNLELVDDALNSTIEHSKNTMFGTGPFATAFGMTGSIGGADQALQAKYKDLTVTNLITQMKGFSKAMDSNAERRAYNAKEASLTNNEDVNVSILLGQKSLLLKTQAEAQAQKAYVDAKGDLDGYQSPVIGKMTSLVTPDGKLVLVPKKEQAKLKKQGFMELDDYSKKATSKGKTWKDTVEQKTKYKTDEIEWAD